MKKSNSFQSILQDLNGNVENYLIDNNIKTRSGTSPGLWLCFMLPLAIIRGTWSYPDCSYFYRTSACLSVGLLLNSLTLIHQVNHSTQFRTACCVINSVTTTLLMTYFTNHSAVFNVLLGIMSSFGFNKLILLTLQTSPESFTFGEAAVIVQAVIIFFTSVFGSGLFLTLPVTCISTSSKILQIGITGLGLLCLSVYLFPQLRKPVEFYSALGVSLLTIPIILHVLFGFSPILWLGNLLFEDQLTVQLVGVWLAMSALAVGATATQVKGGSKASTVVRKYFHVLALFVFLPGLVLKPCLLYVASGIVFALFVGLEALRVLRLPPFSSALDSAFQVYADEKDSSLALTPIYLLVGCAGPLWLHPSPSSPDTLLPLVAGLLSVAVGDTAASVCGSLCGHHKWPDSQKTKEGTAACFISQLFFVIALIHFGYVPKNNLLQPIAAVAMVSLIEATTDQIDNLALPLVMYTMLL